MARRDYERLDLVTFSKNIMRSGDIDPIYSALPRAIPDLAQRKRFLTAYIAYYHAGVACWMSERDPDDFWDHMLTAAINEDPSPNNERWPRSAERRHCRGAAAVELVDRWSRKWPDPSDMWDYFSSGPMDVGSVIKRAKTQYLIGTWLGFKVADLIDATLHIPVDQDDVNVFMYETPVKGILTYWRQREGLPESARPKDLPILILAANEYLAAQLGHITIPHKEGEKIDLFCLETVWCKWYSHLSGHYPLNHDIDAINEGLIGWGLTASLFREAMPERMVQ